MSLPWTRLYIRMLPANYRKPRTCCIGSLTDEELRWVAQQVHAEMLLRQEEKVSRQHAIVQELLSRPVNVRLRSNGHGTVKEMSWKDNGHGVD